jgi:nicotinate dehydrogenase subunit B
VNPDGVANQVEGGCIQAASWTLKEALRAETTNWEH